MLLSVLMEAFKVISLWLDVLLVLLCGCWSVETTTVGKVIFLWYRFQMVQSPS